MSSDGRSGERAEPGGGGITVGQTHVGRRAFLGLMAAGFLALILGPEILPRLRPSGSFLINSVAEGPQFDAATWRLTVNGLVRRPLELTFAELTALPQVDETKDFTCVEGWTVPGVRWTGVPLRELMARADLDPRATHLVFHSGDGVYTDSLTIDEAFRSGVLLAHQMNGELLSPTTAGPCAWSCPTGTATST